MQRRQFLKVVAGAGLGAPIILNQWGCATVLPPPDRSTGLSLYCISGDVTDSSALIWLRAVPGSQVAVQYGRDARLTEFDTTIPFAVEASTDYTAKISLDSLQPATRYYYRGAVNGKLPGPISSFLTAPRADDDAKVTFCFSGDTRQSYKPFTAMDAAAAQRPDFFLHLGDTIYADKNGSAETLPEFWAKYQINRDDFGTQDCLRHSSLYVTWDDHEVEDNFLPGDALALTGWRAFLDYWPVRVPESEPMRIYRSFRWGRAVEIFILDTRQFRDLKRGTMLGEAQKAWLFERIASSAATFKFIATSVTMAGGGSDRWDGFPKERAEILRYINEKKLRGVYFISADMHYAAIARIPKSGGLKDITAGPLGAPLNRITDGTARRFEYFLAENFNFAKITVDPKADPSGALLEFIDQDNQIFHSTTLRA